MSLIAYPNQDGSICFVAIAPDADPDAVIAEDIPAETSYRVISHEDIPADSQYGSAWIYQESPLPTIGIDMAVAREAHRDLMRQARQPLLEVLDVEFMRALELGQETTAIVADKQTLRDAPQNPDIDAAETLEELKAVWPEILGPYPSK